jgi:DNA-binding protein HU-beta
MNKGEFVTFVSEKHKCSKTEAEKVIDMFTSSVIGAISKGKDISLVGFGSFSVSKVAARPGRNPRTGATIQIASYNQPKFKVGQKLKDCCNPGKKK